MVVPGFLVTSLRVDGWGQEQVCLCAERIRGHHLTGVRQVPAAQQQQQQHAPTLNAKQLKDAKTFGDCAA